MIRQHHLQCMQAKNDFVAAIYRFNGHVCYYIVNTYLKDFLSLPSGQGSELWSACSTDLSFGWLLFNGSGEIRTGPWHWKESKEEGEDMCHLHSVKGKNPSDVTLVLSCQKTVIFVHQLMHGAMTSFGSCRIPSSLLVKIHSGIWNYLKLQVIL